LIVEKEDAAWLGDRLEIGQRGPPVPDMLRHLRGEHEIKPVGAEAIDQAINWADLVDAHAADNIHAEVRSRGESFHVPAERAIHVP
jgi:hypothetical protein